MTHLILLKLLLSHILTDFILQPTSWVKHKYANTWKSKYLYIHGLLTGLTVYLLVGQYDNFQIPIFIMITHTIIDGLKLSTKKDTINYFLIDQISHIIILVFCWIWYQDGWGLIGKSIVELQNNSKIIALIIGYTFCTLPTSIIIGKITEKWQKEIEAKDQNESLPNAGKWIGIVERILTLTFVLIDKYEPIGFLLAAKSILRFKESDGKKSEYVLIGTLISFGITIIIGLMLKKIITI